MELLTINDPVVVDTPHPLLNVDVLEIIFHHTHIPTLLTCRSVCSVWNEEASRLLEKLGITASLKGVGALEKFLQEVEPQENHTHPYTSFCIEIPEKYDFSLVWRLLEMEKERLKVVRFEYEMLTDDDTPPIMEETPPTPAFKLPVLTSLHLFATNIFPPKSGKALPGIFEMIETPNLTSLSVQHLYPTECAGEIRKFLKSSEVPITYLRLPSSEFTQIVSENDISFRNLKELDICDLFHSSFATNETIQGIKESCPNLEALTVELGCRVGFQNVYKLLETLQSSLVQLKLTIQDRNLLSRTIQRVNWFFPKMPKLKSLFLRFANPGLVYYIDELPSLTSLELETPWTRKTRGEIFPQGGDDRVYENVRTLNLSEKLEVQDVQKMKKIFPNLHTLCASFKEDLSLQEVYKVYEKELEGLIVDRNSIVTDAAFGVDGNDSSVGQLKGLKSLKIVNLGLTWKSIEYGICQLKHLETLAVQVTTLRKENRDVTEDPSVVQSLARGAPNLKKLEVWTRRNSERLKPEEISFLQQNYEQWSVDTILQTVCSFT